MYELPENLSALTAEELQALIDQGLDALRALGITRDSDEETVAEGERIAALINQVSTVVSERAQDAERGNRADALAELLTPSEPAEPQLAEPEAPAPEAVETVTPDAVIQTPEPVTAATSQSPARRAAANAAPLPVPAATAAAVSLCAAADVPGIPTGAPLEGLTAAAQAVINRMKGLPTTHIGGPDGVRHRYGAAIIRRSGYEELSQVASGGDDYSMVWRAGMESRLPGGSLTAAMGWCAPSETLYDMCVYETVDGILNTPEIEITRGGIRWTPGPDFSDIYDACGFGPFTEAEAIAGTVEKDCCIVECPDFDEIRLDAIGLCVKAPLLTQAAYPELVRRFMEGALVAQQHKVNAYIIAAINAAAGAGVTLPDHGSLSQTLANLEVVAVGQRYRYRMSQTATIEVVAPFWLKVLLRMDLGLRPFADPAATDATINAWFTSRNLSVQWVYDFQSLVVDQCEVTIPATAKVLMYPAGTWVKGRADVINIDAVYDSTGLAQNVYTALFVEEGILAVQRCTHTCAVTIPVCVSGRVGAMDLTECMAFGTGGGVFANTATAGIPGTWGTGEVPGSPNEVRSLNVTASPTTTWTVGQYVQTATSGAPGRVHWHATNGWVDGAAP